MSKRVSVCRREIKVVHLKLFSVHSDNVSLGVPCRRLFMQHLDLPFNDLILSVPICSDQTINVSKHIRKIVQVAPKQSPSNSEHRAHPAFYTLVFPVKDQSGHAANQGSYADEQSENFICENPITASGDLKSSYEI